MQPIYIVSIVVAAAFAYIVISGVVYALVKRAFPEDKFGNTTTAAAWPIVVPLLALWWLGERVAHFAARIGERLVTKRVPAVKLPGARVVKS